MTIANITQARDEILAAFKTAWDAGTETAGKPVIYWDRPDSTPPASGTWARVTVKHVTGSQVTLSGETGQRRFEHTGIVTVQVFTESGRGLTLSDLATEIVINAFEGVTTSPGRVLFRNVRANPVGQDSQWFQQNVLAEFEYDKVR